VKGLIAIVVAVVAALLALGGGYYAFFVAPERRAEQARLVAPESLLVAETTGQVEVAGGDGAFHAAHAGQSLSEHDRIRTGDEGTATLRTADGSTVKLAPATEARVDELRRELKRLHLGTGMLEADVKDDPQRLFELSFQGQSPDDRATARTRGGAFTASNNGAGTSAVAARRGEVILAARGREVVIRSGQFSRVLPGAPPEQPQDIPASLFTKVEWPPARSNRGELTVAGTTQPGARVQITTDGHRRWLKVDDKGAYKTTITVPDGVHDLHVHALDVGGHSADEKSPRIVVDTKTDFQIHPPKWK
jgi:hypothetical protein